MGYKWIRSRRRLGNKSPYWLGKLEMRGGDKSSGFIESGARKTSASAQDSEQASANTFHLSPILLVKNTLQGAFKSPPTSRFFLSYSLDNLNKPSL